MDMERKLIGFSMHVLKFCLAVVSVNVVPFSVTRVYSSIDYGIDRN